MNLLEKLQKCHDKHVSRGEVLAYDSLEFNITWSELLELAKEVYSVEEISSVEEEDVNE